MIVSVESAVQADLDSMGAVGESGLAASVLALARSMDRKPSALVATELRQSLAALRELAPARREADRIDELGSRRAGRRASG